MWGRSLAPTGHVAGGWSATANRVGPDASGLIGEAALTLEMAVTDLKWTVPPHPTLSEGVMEAAEQLYGGAIHLSK